MVARLRWWRGGTRAACLGVDGAGLEVRDLVGAFDPFWKVAASDAIMFLVVCGVGVFRIIAYLKKRVT
jgi:hypothetical protein